MFNNNMECAVCGKELDEPAKRNGIKVRIHEHCITEGLEIKISEALSPFFYKRKDGKLMKGYFHKQHEEV
jgi:hypothetical protein